MPESVLSAEYDCTWKEFALMSYAPIEQGKRENV